MPPIRYDLAFFAGRKAVVIILWLPLAAVLTLVFRPSIGLLPSQIAAFAVAIWGAYLIRSLLLWTLGTVTFWTAHIGAVFEVFFVAELLLPGRVVPMSLMPSSVRSVARFLPFESTSGFPITAFVDPITGAQLVEGLVSQVAWIRIEALGVASMWRRAVRVYTVVSG